MVHAILCVLVEAPAWVGSKRSAPVLAVGMGVWERVEPWGRVSEWLSLWVTVALGVGGRSRRRQ